MRKFLIASHGSLAGGIKSALDIIIGSMENVFVIQAYLNGNQSIEADLNSILANITEQDELVIFTDLLGGSVTNQILRFALRKNVYIVAGINLPLLIDVMLSEPDTPVEEVLESAINNAREQMVYVNRLLTSNQEDIQK